MKPDEQIKKYKILRDNGLDAKQMFARAKQDGLKNFESINLIMILYGLTLDQSREISHSYYFEHKKID